MACCALIGNLKAVDMDVAERILDMVCSIPPGKVSTYGDIAALAGSRAPRLVGRVLAELSDESIPWHRVIRANGVPAHHLFAEQLQLLRSEGVISHDGRVDMRRYRWKASW